MTVSCDFYGINEDRVTLEVEERFLQEQQHFDFEGERYVILSVVWTKNGPKANVMPSWEYASVHEKSPRVAALAIKGGEEPSSVREIDRRRRTP